jgi:predicted porin
MGAVNATNDDASRTGVGVKVDFGIASASVHYAKATLLNQVKNDEAVISVNIPMGNGLDLRGVYRNFDTSDAAAEGSATNTADLKEYTVGLAKALSKRTSVFAAYTTQNRTSTNATGGTDSERFYLGVGHSF